MKKEWSTKQEAAKALGLKDRRVLELADTKGGPIRVKMDRAESGQMVMLFHAGDVERERAQREEAAQAGVSRTVRARTDAGATNALTLAALLPMLQQQAQQAEPAAHSSDPQMNLADAALYIGSTAEDLLDAVRAGELDVRLVRGTRRKHGQMDRCRVTRAALDAWARGAKLPAAAGRARTAGA